MPQSLNSASLASLSERFLLMHCGEDSSHHGLILGDFRQSQWGSIMRTSEFTRHPEQFVP